METSHAYHRAKCESFARKVSEIVRDEVPAFDVSLEYFVPTLSQLPWERVSVVPAAGGELAVTDVVTLFALWRAQNGEPGNCYIGSSGQFEVI